MTAGVLAATASILGFFGEYNWFMDLFSHFRVQYCMGLGVVAMLLLIPRKRRLAAIFGVFAAINSLVILPLYFGRTPAPVANARPIRAMLSNVNTRTGDPAAVTAAILSFAPDIIVLEEINAKWLMDLKPVLDGYQHAEKETREDNFGIGLWSKFPFTHSRVVYIGTAHVPSIIAEIETQQGKCTVLATHPFPPAGKAYSGLRNDQLAELPRWVRRAASPVVLLGDLNTTPWNYTFKRLLREAGLSNSAQGYGVCPTWPSHNPLLLIPLDYCLYTPGIEIVSRQTGPRVGSDHFPIIIDFVVRPEAVPSATSISLEAIRIESEAFELQAAGRNREALQKFREVLVLHPNLTHIRLMVDELTQQMEPRTWLEQHPSDWGAWMSIFAELSNSNMFPEAEAHLKKLPAGHDPQRYITALTERRRWIELKKDKD